MLVSHCDACIQSINFVVNKHTLYSLDHTLWLLLISSRNFVWFLFDSRYYSKAALILLNSKIYWWNYFYKDFKQVLVGHSLLLSTVTTTKVIVFIRVTRFFTCTSATRIWAVASIREWPLSFSRSEGAATIREQPLIKSGVWLSKYGIVYLIVIIIILLIF